MEKFEAKNGLQIEADLGPVVRVWEGSSRDKENNRLRGFSYLNDRAVEALREFFQHERDQELGRWRDPENLHRVAYVTSPQTVLIMDESTGRGTEYSRQTANASSDNYGDRLKRQSARAYFAAHPEPKPGDEAKHLEIWVLTIKGCAPEAYIYRGSLDRRVAAFRPVNNEDRVTFVKGDPLITAARRIWPEVSDA